MVVLVRHYVLLALRVHETLAPLPFELMIFYALRAACGERDLFDRKLGRAVSVEQAIRLLIRVRELRVAAARQQRQGTYDAQEVQVAAGKILLAFGVRIS